MTSSCSSYHEKSHHCPEVHLKVKYEKEKPVTIAGITIVIREKTSKHAHRIFQQIIWSPKNKADGYSVEVHHKHEDKSRKECQSALEKIINEIYK